MGLIGATAGVFVYLHQIFDILPIAVKLLVYGAFGGVVFISLLKGLRG